MGNYYGVTLQAWTASDRVTKVRVTREDDDFVWLMDPEMWTAFLLWPSQSQDRIWENLKSES